MNRRIAMLIGSILAALAAAEIIVLSGLLAAERRGDRERYRDAMTGQRRAAGRIVGASTRAPSTAAPTTFCVRGLDTFITTARKTLHKDLQTKNAPNQRQLDIAQFTELSDLAVRAERYVETSNAGPALPQRLGRVRVEEPGGQDSTAADTGLNDTSGRDTSGQNSGGRDSGAEVWGGTVWQPLQPAQVECGSGDAYAVFRLDVDRQGDRQIEQKVPTRGRADKRAVKKPGRRGTAANKPGRPKPARSGRKKRH